MRTKKKTRFWSFIGHFNVIFRILGINDIWRNATVYGGGRLLDQRGSRVGALTAPLSTTQIQPCRSVCLCTRIVESSTNSHRSHLITTNLTKDLGVSTAASQNCVLIYCGQWYCEDMCSFLRPRIEKTETQQLSKVRQTS